MSQWVLVGHWREKDQDTLTWISVHACSVVFLPQPSGAVAAEIHCTLLRQNAKDSSLPRLKVDASLFATVDTLDHMALPLLILTRVRDECPFAEFLPVVVQQVSAAAAASAARDSS